MKQIGSERYDYVKEQLTSSYRQSQIYQGHGFNPIKSSFVVKKQSQQDNTFEEIKSNQEGQTLGNSIKSSRMTRKIIKARIQIESIQSIVENEDCQSSYFDQVQLIIVIQKWIRGFLCQKKYQKKLQQARYRRSVFQELFTKEQKYINDLEIIVLYLQNKIRLQQLLTDDEMQQLFLNVEQILQLNYQFLTQLKQINITYHHYSIISTHIRRLLPFFKIYYDYCSRFNIQYIEELREQNPKFNQFITKVEFDYDQLKGLSLESFLVKPVQQLPRYVLFFQQILKSTEKTHPDYDGLQAIVDGFICINKKMDFMMNTTKQNLKLLTLYGTTDQREIDIIQQRKQEEEQNIFIIQKNISIKVAHTIIQKDHLSSFQVYVIEIIVKQYRFRTFQRFSDMFRLKEFLFSKIPELNIPYLNKNWLQAFSTNSHKIEERADQIQKFLLTIFKSNYLKQIQDILIQSLDLPDNFFDINMEQEIKIKETDDLPNRDSYLQLKSSQVIKFSRNTYNFTRNSIQPTLFLPVSVILADGRTVNLEISKTCRCLDLLETLSRSIKLESYVDFKIIVSVDFKERVVDDNEVIYKILRNYNLQNEDSFSRIIHKITDFFSNAQSPTFYFKKCLYLSQEMENRDYFQDDTRMRLLIYQSFNEIRENFYGFDVREYEDIVSYYILIKYYQISLQIHNPNSIDLRIIKELVPQKILKKQKGELWRHNVYFSLSQIRQQLEKRKKNQQIKTMIQTLYLSELSKHELYGVKLFRVKRLPKNNNCQIMGICFKSILMFDEDMNKIEEISIEDIVDLDLKMHMLNVKYGQGKFMQLKCESIFDVYRYLEEYMYIEQLEQNIRNTEYQQ